jgi:hypothetical protein
MRSFIRAAISLLVVISLILIFVYSRRNNAADVEMTTDVLVVGGTPGGVGAAIASSRLGQKTMLVSQLPWVGGTFTSEAVSFPDEGWPYKELRTQGILGEFKERIKNFYGKDFNIYNANSPYNFLPWEGEEILRDMLQKAGATVLTNMAFVKPIKQDNVIVGAIFRSSSKKYLIHAKRVLDCTWNGDVAIAAGCNYKSKRESYREAGEFWAPDKSDDFENPITAVLVAKDMGRPVPSPPIPKDYNKDNFNLLPGAYWKAPPGSFMGSFWKSFGLPKGYIVINYGHDLFASGYSEMPRSKQKAIENQARSLSLCFWYYLKSDPRYSEQTRNYGLATEFGTPDRGAIDVYHRSSRRIVCEYMLNAHDIAPRYNGTEKADYPIKVFPDSICIGDYFMDIHGPIFNRPPYYYRPFNIPYKCLIPRGIDNLLIGDLAIGTTFLAQSATRLNAVRMRLGQSAGIAAALSVKENIAPAKLSASHIQKELKKQGVAYKYP